MMNLKYGIVKSSILRGRLGIDNFFIGFALFGVFLIPSFFYFWLKFANKNMDRLRMEKIY